VCGLGYAIPFLSGLYGEKMTLLVKPLVRPNFVFFPINPSLSGDCPMLTIPWLFLELYICETCMSREDEDFKQQGSFFQVTVGFIFALGCL